MKILISLFSPPTSAWGALTRAIALANEFRDNGDQVAFCAPGSMVEILQKNGWPVYPVPEPTIYGLPWGMSAFIQKSIQRTSFPVRKGQSIGNIWFLYYLAGLTKKTFLSNLVEAQLSAVDDFRPECLLAEMDPAAHITSLARRLPLAIIYANLSLTGIGSYYWRKMKSSLLYVLDKHGLPLTSPEEVFLNRKVLKIIPSIPELDKTDPHREDVCYVGCLNASLKNNAPDFIPAKGRKYLFVYLGLGAIPLQKVKTTLPEAFKLFDDLECLVVSKGVAVESQINNVRFLPYLPADQILPHCAMTICHGGLNTITQSLEHGVPLMTFPGPIFDRRYNSYQVVEQGAGFMGEFSDFNHRWLRNAFNKRDELRDNLSRLQRRFNEYGKAPAAVSTILQWIKER